MEYAEVMQSSLEYFNGEELPAKVFVDKYALRDNDDNFVESTPDDTHKRIASELARVEAKKFKKPYSYEDIYSWIKRFGYICPQGSPMYGIGNPYQSVTLSNCYVINPPLDSYGGIHKTDEQISQISKRRGGCGTDISYIRPVNAPTKNSSKKSTGIVSFMDRFSNSIREVGQDGRRGALMLTLSVHHPEVLNFASIKKDRSRITGANLSIRLSDEFLRAVKENKQYEQRWPVDSDKPVISQMVNARDVWKQIIECAWDMAEPGLLFWDSIIRESPADCYFDYGFRTVSTNPCSELPLSILDSCRLLFLNLFKFVVNPFTEQAYFDFDKFYDFAQIAQRLMDDIVDLEIESIDKIITKIQADPEPIGVKSHELEMWQEIRLNCINGRRTGTGITALGDTLAAIGVRYGTEESIKVTERIYQTLKFGCYRSSVDMAKELGPFPIWNNDLEKDNNFLNRMFKEKIQVTREDLIEITEIENDIAIDYIRGGQIMMEMEVFGRRNIALLTTAPVGSGSMLAELAELKDNVFLHGTSSGIEPVFMLAYTRRKKNNPNDKGSRVDFVDQNGDSWQEFPVYHPALKYWMEVTGNTDIKKSPWYGCCADDIDWKNRVRLQAAAQRHIDHAISSTINLPENVEQNKVAEIYEAAWEYGLKGITVYRKNCRSGVLVELDKKEKDVKITKRPKDLRCDIYHLTVSEKEYLVLVGLDNNGQPYEVLAAKNGKIGKKAKHGKITKIKRGCYKLEADTGEIIESVTSLSTDNEEAITRLVSTLLRSGVKIEYIVDQLEKVNGPLHCFAKSVVRALKKYIKDGTKVHGEKCLECGSELIRIEGCKKCCQCGWSKC